MSTLATKKIEKDLRIKADIWLFIAMFFCLFGRVYEQFSNQVFSYYMLYAFAYALVLGGFLRILLIRIPMKYMMGNVTSDIYNCGVMTLTIGDVIHGMLQIYGTFSPYVKYFRYVGTGLVIFAVFLFVLGMLSAQGEE